MKSKPKYLHAPGAGHYGNESLAVRTQEEVAKELGLTPQRVSQIEREAFAKIRRFFVNETSLAKAYVGERS